METRYRYFSDLELGSLFCDEVWNTMDVVQKVAVCQEVENRLAAERSGQPRTVCIDKMEGSTYGFQSGDYIVLNESVLEEGKVYASYQNEAGETISRGVAIDAPGFMMYDTVCHEDTHGVQRDEQRMPSYDAYMEPETMWCIYRIQPCEAEAFRKGNQNTLEMIKKLQQEAGIYTPEMEKYMDYVEYNSYTQALDQAKQFCMDENVQDTLQQVITDKEQGVVSDSVNVGYRILDNMYQQQDRKRLENRDIMDMFENLNQSTIEQHLPVQNETGIEI